MKFQRRILPPHSPTYLEMEEYLTPTNTQPTSNSSVFIHFLSHRFISSPRLVSIADSTSDLSEIESVCSLSTTHSRQRSDSLTNLFNMSEDNTSLSNFSIASYSLSQTSYDNGSPTTCTTLSPQPSSSLNMNSDRTTRSRRSIGSLTTSSQKNFSIKPAETGLNPIGMHSPPLSDKCGLIANDGNNVENLDDHQIQYDDEENFCDSGEENDLDMITPSNNRGLRKTVLNNVDRLLNSGNKQIKL